MKVAAIQMCASHQIADNLAIAEKLIQTAVQNGAKLIVLPEMFAIMGLQENDKVKAKEIFGVGPIQKFLATTAKENHVWIVGGTIPIATAHSEKIAAACLVFDDTGQCVARYDKIHLFDVILSKTERYQESDSTLAGNEVVVVDTPIGKLGLAVCYDVRFPRLFEALVAQGAEIIALPSAFTAKTGAAHWELLTRCRAIDTFCYLIGANQGGTHSNGRQTHGHSLIVDPWGKIIAEQKDKSAGIIEAMIDLEKVKQIRTSIPILKNQNAFQLRR